MDEQKFLIVRNHEEQYSVWAAELPLPAGWQQVGTEGSKEKCLEYIRTHWTDMTPASLRRALAG
ncbi:MAG: MbtH family NRPS accessory protein [Burkholderiales bacterium]|jgi:MbtH protein|nr:MbtH family NRPS accessory protein [Burkholderiales bacterium]